MFHQTVPINADDFVDVGSVSGWDVVWALVIVAVAVLVSAIVRRLMRRWLSSFDDLPEAAAAVLRRTTGYVIVIIGVMLALPLLGFDTQPVMMVLLLLAVLVFFTGRPLMESFAAGVIIQARSPFGVGDLIQHQDFIGSVRETNGRTTVIITPDGETVAIPNVAMLRDPIRNLSTEGARRTTVNVGVAYGTDLDVAVNVITEAISGLDAVLDDPPSIIGVADYEDSAIRIEVRSWHLPSILDEFVARDEIIRSVDRALELAGIVIAFPQRDVWLRESSTELPWEEEQP